MGLVSFDWTRDVVRLGESEFPVAVAGTHGEIRLGSDDGPVLRPLSFGERWRAVTRARSSGSPAATLARLVHRDATVREGAFDLLGQQIVALAMAYDAEATLSYADTALVLSRAGSAPLSTLADMEAAAVDRLAISLSDVDDEWTRVSFVAAGAGSLEEILESLALAMLQRDDTAVRPSSAPDASASGGGAPVDEASARAREATDRPLQGASSVMPAGRDSFLSSSLDSRQHDSALGTEELAEHAPLQGNVRDRAAEIGLSTRFERTAVGLSMPNAPDTQRAGSPTINLSNAVPARCVPLPWSYEAPLRQRTSWRLSSPGATATRSVAPLPLGHANDAPAGATSWPAATATKVTGGVASLGAWDRNAASQRADSLGLLLDGIAPDASPFRSDAADDRSLDIDDVAELLARLLDQESDLRGLDA